MAIKIYIDQGHNPTNPNAGAEGNGLYEQDITYEIGRRLYLLLEEDSRYEARLSRPEKDTQLGTSIASSLSARTTDANSWGADYFISIHCDASQIASASGSSAFVYALGSRAAAFGQSVLNAMCDYTGLPNRGLFARPTLYVLRKTVLPAVLVETAFITNPGDAALLRDDPQIFARGMYNGINNYFGY